MFAFGKTCLFGLRWASGYKGRLTHSQSLQPLPSSFHLLVPLFSPSLLDALEEPLLPLHSFSGLRDPFCFPSSTNPTHTHAHAIPSITGIPQVFFAMKLTLFSVTLLSALLPLAAAHGFVSKVVIGGTTYKGNAPGASAKASPIRQISTTDPVKGATNKNINCGQNAKAASLVAAANPGDTMSFTWDAGDGSHVSTHLLFWERIYTINPP